MDYGYILMFVFLNIAIVAGGIIINYILMPYKPTSEKLTTYECGNDPVGDARIRYRFKFYVFALLYVIFAVEAAFLFPWAVIFKKIHGLLPFIEAFIFIVILVFGLVYAWNKGELKWD
ncbi:MAG: NADH-quinone oxidoreductase subunit A [Candidatus Goldbacteria bacterium]|nr:NADH-quinone oxidoreductase subunit A [Candidatus Goldiibacteriota bacterium]